MYHLAYNNFVGCNFHRSFREAFDERREYVFDTTSPVWLNKCGETAAGMAVPGYQGGATRNSDI